MQTVQGDWRGHGSNISALRLAGGRHVVPQSRGEQRSGQFAVPLCAGGRLWSAGAARPSVHVQEFRPERRQRQLHPTAAAHRRTIAK